MIDQEFTHREAVLTVAYRLMGGKRVSLARLGELRVVHECARNQGATWFPPADRVIFDPARTQGESEPPSAIDFLSRDIRNSLAKDGHARIDGLGVFSSDNDGISFSPSGDLMHVANHAFAHLEAHDEPQPLDGALAAPDTREPDSEVPANEPESENVPVSGATVASVDTPPPSDDSVLEGAGTEDTPQQEHAVRARPTSPRSPRDLRKPEHGLPPWAIAVIIAVPLIFLGLFAFRNDRDMDASNDNDADVAHVLPEKPKETSVPDSTERLVENVAPEDSESDPAPAGAEAPESTRPSFLTRGMAGYTLITASTSEQASAEAQLETFERLNLPTGVLYFDTADGPRYRAAIGQWPSAAAADSARQAFANELPAGTWVKRLN
ncbi:MAG: hypothetical protein COV99_08305 [Bacteroidetes bacterium CG12_big_fil_rev_8_21_14_0_65_60_17]|nr:MAG: hypothetical protein COV99_08305 [Bacteroidetes bacterium CG12_big_fil_rev_8_21_14_0_65_60_17]